MTEKKDPYRDDDYEPKFDRLSTARRVLGFVTDEEHLDHGQRNTVENVARELADDPNTPKIRADGDLDAVQGHVDSLVSVGLLDVREDGTLAVTLAGHVELRN